MSDHHDVPFDRDPRVLAHLRKLRVPSDTSPESYLAATFKSSVDSGAHEAAAAILLAAILYLAPSPSEPPSSQASVGATPSSARNTLASTVATFIDADSFSTRALLLAAEAAADVSSLPLLAKTLQVVARLSEVSPLGQFRSIDDPEFETQGTLEKENKTPLTGAQVVDSFVVAYLERVDDPWWRAKGGPLFVASLLRETPLSDPVFFHCLQSLLRRLSPSESVVELDEAPSFIYQLLLLASSGPVSKRHANESRRAVVHAVIHYFHGLENRVLSASDPVIDLCEPDDAICSVPDRPVQNQKILLRQAQGTVLLYFDFAARQEPSLASEIIRLAKSDVESPLSILTPFGCAVLLVIARSSASYVKVVESILSTIQKYRREVLRRNSSSFARKLSRSFENSPDPEQSLQYAIEASANGWDYIVEPALAVVLALIDSEARSMPTADAAIRVSSTNSMTRLVDGLFRLHPPLRGELIEQLLSRVFLRENSSRLAIHLLGHLARHRTLQLLELGPKIKENVDDIVTLPPDVAASLLMALAPVFRSRSDLRDYVILALRKALVRRDASPRAVAAVGFLEMVVQNVNSATPSTSVAFETAGFLRRTLTHQTPVRTVLYSYVRKLVYEKRMPLPVMQSVLSLLRSHLSKYISVDEVPYLRLECCLSDSTSELTEDVADLVLTIHVLEYESRSIGGISSPGQEEEVDEPAELLKLARNVAQCSLEQFDLDKDSDYKNSSRDRNVAFLLRDILKSLIGVSMDSGSTLDDEELGSTIMSLVEKRQTIVEALAEARVEEPWFAEDWEAGKSKRGPAGRKSKSQDPGTQKGEAMVPLDGRQDLEEVIRQTPYMRKTFPISFLSRVMRVTSGAGASGRPASQPLGLTHHLSSFLIAEIASAVKVRPDIDRTDEDFEKHVLMILPALMAEFQRIRSAMRTTKRQPGGLQAVLEQVHHCFEGLYIRKPTSWRTLCLACAAVLGEPDPENDEGEGLVDQAAGAFESLSASLIEDTAAKEAVLALRILATVRKHARQCGVEGSVSAAVETFCAKRAQWAKDLAVGGASTDGAVLKAVLSFGVEEFDLKVVGRLISSVHRTLGESEVDGVRLSLPASSGDGRVLTEDACYATLPALMKMMESALEDVEWAYQHASALADLGSPAAGCGRGARKRAQEVADASDDAGCRLLQRVVETLARLLRCSVRKWSIAEGLLRVASRCYKSLTVGAKRLVATKSQPGREFQSLVESCGKYLTPSVYIFISVVSDARSFEETRQKIGRESRLIPSLVYNVENYERLLLKLDKLLGDRCQFLRAMKRSTARDFKIDLRRLAEDDEDDGSDGDSGTGRAPKRGRHQSH